MKEKELNLREEQWERDERVKRLMLEKHIEHNAEKESEVQNDSKTTNTVYR